MIQNSICDSKHSNFQPYDSNIRFYGTYGDSRKIMSYVVENTILGQLKMEEHQAKCRALLRKLFYHRWL